MAMPPPPRRAAVLLLSLIVLSAVALSAATSRSHAELHDRQRQAADEDALAERCGGGAGVEGEDEECLMRRTLEAHTDYIYTQGGGHN
ncbi:hypothetical protein BS78_05G168100 [Paspalum vaginatum]|nr:hypothetical protein BS78_05G168100 [Paspalum vaginatum]